MAATIFRKAAGAAPEIEFHAGVHQEAPPDVAGREVVIVDFSYKREIIRRMAAEAESILIVDHHVSARDDLVDLPANVRTVFDMEKSGAGLAWREFMAPAPAPAIVDYIEAYDLWRLEAFPDVKPVIACLKSYEHDFGLWTSLLEADQKELIAAMAKEGAAIERAQAKAVRDIVRLAAHEMEIDGVRVPAVNAPRKLSSEAAGALAAGKPFAACYHLAGEDVNFSLRSERGGADVAKIAFKYGGGGHKHAAGFKIKAAGGELTAAIEERLRALGRGQRT